MEKIFFVGGGKGGVGKTLATMALLDYSLSNLENPLLVESDTSNPDVFMSYKNEVKTETLVLDEADGWIELVNAGAAHDGPIVINSGARIDPTQGIENLEIALPELNRALVIVWVINTQRDSLELLRKFRDVVKNAQYIIFKNLHFGSEEKFSLYNESELKQEIEAERGISISFPQVANRVTHDIYVQRMSIARGMREMPLGSRAELSRWRKQVYRIFNEAGL